MAFSSIRLEENIFPKYKVVNSNKQEDTEVNVFDNLSKINILVGSNNSGKSRFLRTLFSNDNYQYNLKEVDIDLIQSKIRELEKDILSPHGGFYTFVPVLRNIVYPKFLRKPTSINDLFIGNRIDTLIKDDSYFKVSNDKTESNFYSRNLNIETKNSIKKLIDHISEVSRFSILPLPNKVYIPILRGLRPIQSHYLETFIVFKKDNNYLQRTQHDYFKKLKIGSEEKVDISTGLDFYEKFDNHQRSGEDLEQKLAKEFEEFIGNTFFQGKEVRITPVKNQDVVNIKIGNEKPRPIYELGDGIQAIILLTYPLFFNKGKKMAFFYEEPETHLHPGFQRIFIETLLRPEFSDFQYFFTTHSNHFLDITLDEENISIYSFRKNDEKGHFEIENVKSGDNNVLQMIGVQNSSVFLSNCTIWVEGITDRMYIRKYLEVYMKSSENTEGVNFKEDFHYSFIEYSGNNITHWSFLEDTDADIKNINVDRICNRLFLITDQDGAGLSDTGKVEKDAKKKRHEKLKEKLGEEHYYCLECREIENLISEKILREVIKKREKNNPELIIKTFKDYKVEKLGRYIESRLENRKKKFADDSGTIYNKTEFAKIAIENIERFEDLSDEAKNLTKKLYAFIKKNNA